MQTIVVSMQSVYVAKIKARYCNQHPNYYKKIPCMFVSYTITLKMAARGNTLLQLDDVLAPSVNIHYYTLPGDMHLFLVLELFSVSAYIFRDS